MVLRADPVPRFKPFRRTKVAWFQMGLAIWRGQPLTSSVTFSVLGNGFYTGADLFRTCPYKRKIIYIQNEILPRTESKFSEDKMAKEVLTVDPV